MAQREAGQFAHPGKAIDILMNHVAGLNKIDLTKVAIDELLPWSAAPEVLPPTSSDGYGNLGSENLNTEVNPEPTIEPGTGMANGEGGTTASIHSGGGADEWMFEGPSPEELAAASGPGNLNSQFGAPVGSQDATPEPNDDGALSGALRGNGPVMAKLFSDMRLNPSDAWVREDGNRCLIIEAGKVLQRHASKESAVTAYGKIHANEVLKIQVRGAILRDAEYHYIKKDGDKWAIWQKSTGKTLSTHDSKEEAEAAFRAMMMNKHGGSRAQTPIRADYDEYLNRLSPGAAASPRDNYYGTLAAISPSTTDPSLPEWGRTNRPKANPWDRLKGAKIAAVEDDPNYEGEDFYDENESYQIAKEKAERNGEPFPPSKDGEPFPPSKGKTAADYRTPPEPEGMHHLVEYLNRTGEGPSPALESPAYGGEENAHRDYDIGYFGHDHGLKMHDSMSDHTHRGHEDRRNSRSYDPEGSREHYWDAPDKAFSYYSDPDGSKLTSAAALAPIVPIRRRAASYDPIAYTYEADHHCPECAFRRFGRDEHGFVPENATDREGNGVGAVAPWDEWQQGSGDKETLSCGTCGKKIDEYDPHKYASRRRTADFDDPKGNKLGDNPMAFTRADESSAPDITPNGSGSWDPYEAWVQSGNAQTSLPLQPQGDMAATFDNITDFPDTGPSEVSSERAPIVQENKTGDSSGSREATGSRRQGAKYFRHDPTDYTFESVPMHQAQPGDITIAGGKKAIVQEVHHHAPGEHPQSPIRNDLHAVEVKTDQGSRWGGVNTPTEEFRNDLGVYRPNSSGFPSESLTAQGQGEGLLGYPHQGAKPKEFKQDSGYETGGNGGNTPGAYEPDRSLNAESPQGQADDTKGYEQAYSSGRPINWTETGETVLGNVPVEGYEYNADHPNAESWPFVLEPLGSGPRGAADVGGVPTPGVGGYPQPQVAKNAQLDKFRAAIAARS